MADDVGPEAEVGKRHAHSTPFSCFLVPSTFLRYLLDISSTNMSITHITTTSELNTILGKSKDKLTVRELEVLQDVSAN